MARSDGLDDGLGDGAGDDEPAAPLLPPDDRIWRHPSEVADHGSSRQTPTRPRPTLPNWPIGLAVWLLGGVAGAVVVTAWSGVAGRDDGIAIPAVEQVVAPGVTSPMNAPWEAVVAIAERMRSVVVEVRADGPGGTVTGTGVVFRSDGHVLTNHHVVDGARRIVVVTADGHRVDGHSLGGDPETDIAVVKMDGPTMPSAVMGSAASLRVGQMAMALGAAKGGARPRMSIGVAGREGCRPPATHRRRSLGVHP
ncbi:MAG: S1C family serine protease [Acidimicrobiales bacterium]